MAVLLAFDTSTMTSSAAVLDGERVLAEQDALASRNEEALLPLIERVLVAAGVDSAAIKAIACGVGPGSFTGLRIGLATAKGLCFALSVPLTGVSSMAALALEAPATGAPVLVVTDARRGEVYAALYQLGVLPVELIAEHVTTPDALVARVREITPARVHIVGDGVDVIRTRLADLGDAVPGARITPRASAIGRLAAARVAAGAPDELGSATPSYLRLTPAEETILQKRPVG